MARVSEKWLIFLRVLPLYIFLFVLSLSEMQGQVNQIKGFSTISEESIIRKDTARELRKRDALTASLPDTNFTFEKYADFLEKVSDTSKYLVLPVNDFRKTINSNKIVIGLRHDVDLDLYHAYDFSSTESALGVRSTYYILHTASYYLANQGVMATHTAAILPTLKFMQDERNFEIGWHNDLVTLQAAYNINSVTFLHNELAWLRSNGINIYGSASHGSGYCYTYKYLNFYFFEECTYPVVGQFVNNLTLPLGGNVVPMLKGKFSDFGLEYEAYFLNNNKYYSDASITNGIRWNTGMLDINTLVPGDRVIILLHPVHWHRASVNAVIESFSIPGQISSSINKEASAITVLMPYGTDRSSLLSDFTLSGGAYTKAGGIMQVSNLTQNDFNLPVTFRVYAENRDIIRNWEIKVEYEQLTPVENDPLKEPLLVYPNPSDGIINLQFSNIATTYILVDIFNTLGEKVYTERIDKSGTFRATVDLRKLSPGIYYLKYTGSLKSFTIIINPRN